MSALVYAGSLPIPGICPQLQLAIGLPAIQLSASLSGALSLQASLTATPPTASAYLAALSTTEGQLSLAAALSLPAVAFDLSVSTGLEASFAASLALVASFELGLSLSAFLSASVGIYAFTYEGSGTGLGAALTTALATSWVDGSPTSVSCTAFVLGATSTASGVNVAAFLSGLSFGSGLTVSPKLASIADLSPLTAGASTQAQASIAAKAAAQARVSASLRARGSVSLPSPQATLTALATYQANLVASLSLAPPSVAVAVSAAAKIAANVSATSGLMAALGACMGRFDETLFAYAYTGTGTGLGAALTTALATTWGDGLTPSSGPCTAVVLAATDTFSVGVLGAFFGGV
jgi:hypothetical protein